MIFVHKLAPAIVSPLFVVLLFILLGWLFKSRWLTAVAFVGLLVASNPIVGVYTSSLLEADQQIGEVSELEQADYVVVLSGMVRTIPAPGGDFRYEFGDAVDRFHAGLEIIRQNKADKIVFTRGLMPWSVGMPEGEYLAQYAQELGIDPARIELTDPVENTADEARAVGKMLEGRNPSVILVTSAFHMPRAKLLFEAEGMEVTPFPVDFRQNLTTSTPMDLLPNAEALMKTTRFVREMIGRAYYALRG